MNKYLKIFIFGILIWLIPFLISFLIYPIREENRILFESIMPVILTALVLLFSIFYLKNVEIDFFGEGLLIGIVWFVVSIAIDLVMFMPESDWQMSLTDYMMDIGLTYIIIAIIPLGFGYILDKMKTK